MASTTPSPLKSPRAMALPAVSLVLSHWYWKRCGSRMRQPSQAKASSVQSASALAYVLPPTCARSAGTVRDDTGNAPFFSAQAITLRAK